MQIKEKIEQIGTPLKDWDIQINYGIKTGFNAAFIIDDMKRRELIELDPKSSEIIRPNNLYYLGFHTTYYWFFFVNLFHLFVLICRSQSLISEL